MEKEERKTLPEIIGEAIGAATMCWVETPESEFDATAAKLVMDQLVKDVQAWAKAEYGKCPVCSLVGGG